MSDDRVWANTLEHSDAYRGTPGSLGQELPTFTVVQCQGVLCVCVRARAVALHGVNAAGLHQVNNVHAVDFGETLGQIGICAMGTTPCSSVKNQAHSLPSPWEGHI